MSIFRRRGRPPIANEVNTMTNQPDDPVPGPPPPPRPTGGSDPPDDPVWSTLFGRPRRDDGPYERSQEHLNDELRRLDRLIRAATHRWHYQLARHKDAEDWGMLRVDQSEVEAFLDAPWRPPESIPGALEDELAREWREAREEAGYVEARLAATPPETRAGLRVDALRRLFGLSDFERDVLLLCLLPELDARYRRLFGLLMDDASRTQPTIELILAILPAHLYENPAGKFPGRRAVFAPAGRLLRHNLLVMGGEARGDEALIMRSLRLDDRIRAYLLGDDRPDARLTGVLVAADDGHRPLILNPDENAELEQLADRLAALSKRGPAVVYLHGPYGGGRRARAAYLAGRLGRPLLAADAAAALTAKVGWPLLVDLVYREARLRGAAVYWLGCQALLAENQPPANGSALLDAAENYNGLSLLGSDMAWEPAGRFRHSTYWRLDCPTPDYTTRIRLWRAYLDEYDVRAGDPDTAARQLANDFIFTAGQMEDALVSAFSIARGPAVGEQAPADLRRPALTLSDLYEGCRRQSSRNLVTLARRVRPRPNLSLDDVILPEANRRQLQEVFRRDRLRSRLFSDLEFGRKLRLGKGLVVLFTGTSGTGKTLAAEALAAARGVELYQVDLSAIVSKWVGETEKNINRVFAEVEGANAILFFDEADALFGKRAEVKDAQDRWANMEINYLLQRIEDYSGTVVLASNLRQNIDDAFLRRIHMLVDFPFPDARLRRAIFRRVLPETVAPPPPETLDRIADAFRLTGGGIKNSVVDATFRALDAGRVDDRGRPQVTEEDLVLGIAREYQKLGRALGPDEFLGPHFELVVRTLLNPEEQPAAVEARP